MRLYAFILLCSVSLSALSPSQAFEKLAQGNKRFQNNALQSKDASQRHRFTEGQAPFAIIVACADSRIAPEILFDQWIGDLFVIRVAGNVIGPLEMESVEFAVKYLGSSCILVMGHEECGAVNAVVKGTTEDVLYIAQLISPSVAKARASHAKNVLETAVKNNAEAASDFIKQSSIVAKAIKEGKVDVRAAYYTFGTGAVEMLP